jgi:hypothetical protein
LWKDDPVMSLTRRNRLGKDGIPSYIAPFMKFARYWILFSAVALIAFQACNGNGTEPEEESVLSDPQSLFDDRDNTFYVAVTVTLSGAADPDSVWTEMYLETGTLADLLGTDTLMAAVGLSDSGKQGDILPLDDIYGREFDTPLPVGTDGSVRFVYHALVEGDTSTVTDILRLENLRPVILSVTASDTLSLPPSPQGSLIYYTLDELHAEVTDPDGLGDIREVSFTTLKPDSTLGNQGQPIPLRDNGEPEWGDDIDGDGIYSVIIQLQAEDAQGDPTLTGAYVYRFVARDYSGQRSDTTYHTVQVIEYSP